tara:strand:- start:103 stop:609 length:507 start_codon:yes stop_codon:yes gene_type:complete
MDAGVMRIEANLDRLNTMLPGRPNRLGAVIGTVELFGDYLVIAGRTFGDIDLESHPTCEQLLWFIENGMGFCPEVVSSTEMADETKCEGKQKRETIYYALEKLFSHHGYSLKGRPQKLGAMLSEFLVVEAAIIPNNESKQFCHRVAAGPIVKGSWLQEYINDAAGSGN